jgi:hypothetical protein
MQPEEAGLQHCAFGTLQYLLSRPGGAALGDGHPVWDVALGHPGFWSALWAVDPEQAPTHDPQIPVWLSAGELSRRPVPGSSDMKPARRESAMEAQGEDHDGA